MQLEIDRLTQDIVTLSDDNRPMRDEINVLETMIKIVEVKLFLYLFIILEVLSFQEAYLTGNIRGEIDSLKNGVSELRMENGNGKREMEEMKETCRQV